MRLKRARGRSSIRGGVGVLGLSLWLVATACTGAGRPAAPGAPPAAPAPARAIVVSSAGESPAGAAQPAEPAQGAAPPAAGPAPGAVAGGSTMAQQRLAAPAATPIPGTLKAAERAALAGTAAAGTPGPTTDQPGGPTPMPTLRPAAPPPRGPRIGGMAAGPVVRDRPVDARGIMRADSLTPAPYKPLRPPAGETGALPAESLAGAGAVGATA